MNSHRIAFATCASIPAPTADDQLAVRALAEHDIHVEAAVWSDTAVHWRGFDAVVLRSTWDYHRRPAEFHAWLDRLDAENVRLWNPVPLARWNADKRYLRELEQRGVPIVPTVWLEPGAATDARTLLAAQGWTSGVLKPAVAATAYRTVRIDHEGSATDGAGRSRDLAELLRSGVAMLQPYLASVADDGEWSLIFFDGAFSHAVLKRPAPGDFRVQAEFGGTAEAARAPDAVVAAAAAVLERVEHPWVYARVDGVRAPDGAFLLMELEMLEPSLFLALEPEAPRRFADAIRARLTP